MEDRCAEGSRVDIRMNPILGARKDETNLKGVFGRFDKNAFKVSNVWVLLCSPFPGNWL